MHRKRRACRPGRRYGDRCYGGSIDRFLYQKNGNRVSRTYNRAKTAAGRAGANSNEGPARLVSLHQFPQPKRISRLRNKRSIEEPDWTALRLKDSIKPGVRVLFV